MSGPVEEFIRSFNERDLDGFVAVLDPEVEIHGMRATRRGVGEAREWATRAPGGVQQEILLDEIRTPDGVPAREGAPSRDGPPPDGPAVALIRRRMYWDEDGSEAGTDAMAWRFELRNGRVRAWWPYEDREAALRDAGLLGD